MSLSLNGWPISAAQITSIMQRQHGGANISVRVLLFVEAKDTVSSALTGAPSVSGGNTILPIDTGLSGLAKGERIVIGTLGGNFESKFLLDYDSSTGHAKVNGTLVGTYSTGTPVFQSLLQFKPVNGFGTAPPGVTSGAVAYPHYSNDIVAFCTAIKTTMDTTQSVMRSLSMTVTDREDFRLDRERSVFKVYLDIWDRAPSSDGAVVLCDVPVFTGYIAQTTGQIAAENTPWQVTALDPTCKAAQVGFLNSYACPQGANIASLILQMLTMDDLPAKQSLGANGGTGVTPAGLYDAGPNMRVSQCRIPATSSTMPYVRLCSVEDGFKLAAINAMLKSYNCWPLFSDAYGNVRSEPMPYYTDTVPHKVWNFVTDKTSIFVDPQQMAYTSIDQRANTVVIVSNPSGGAGLRADYENTNPSSLISTTHLNRTISREVRDDYIFDQATANLRAKLEVQLDAIQDQPITIQTLPMPFAGLDPYDAIEVNYSNQFGPQIHSASNDLYIVVGATLDLSTLGAFRQTMTCKKIVLV